jgi:hypothetical protein
VVRRHIRSHDQVSLLWGEFECVMNEVQKHLL